MAKRNSFQCTRVYQNAQAREERVRELYGDRSNGSQGDDGTIGPNGLTLNPFYPEAELDAIHREWHTASRMRAEVKEEDEEEEREIKEEAVDGEQVVVSSDHQVWKLFIKTLFLGTKSGIHSEKGDVFDVTYFTNNKSKKLSQNAGKSISRNISGMTRMIIMIE